jgi:2-phosphoglycerate kinase
MSPSPPAKTAVASCGSTTEPVDPQGGHDESPALPLVLLIGGATGTGKSTVATEVAHRLRITRVTSTDFIRQTIRAFVPAETMPSVHASSFEAGASFAESEDPTLAGFLEQTRIVLVGVEAVVSRAVREGLSLILEGVHLVPGMLTAYVEEALVVTCVLRIDGESAHRSHFATRHTTTQGRRAMEKYLDALGDIRHIQDYIVDRATVTGAPIIENTGTCAAASEVIELIAAASQARVSGG